MVITFLAIFHSLVAAIIAGLFKFLLFAKSSETYKPLFLNGLVGTAIGLLWFWLYTALVGTNSMKIYVLMAIWPAVATMGMIVIKSIGIYKRHQTLNHGQSL